MSSYPIGYVGLLRHNKAFRRLWYGQVVSQLGDWFDSIALFALLLRLTGSGQAIGALLVAQFLPVAIVGLFAGVVVDRLPRKLVMIVSNLGSAALVLLLTLFGRQIFPLGVDGALSIGLLYAARGIGAGIGPIVARRMGGDGQQFLRRAIGPAFLCTTFGYIAFSGAPWLWLAALAVVLAHIGGSIQWVFSTSLLQMNVPNRLQGRVFAVEGALLTLATALSSYITGVAADAGWTPRALALLLSAVFVLPGLALWPARRSREPLLAAEGATADGAHRCPSQ
jgi:MFS family permease